MEGPRQEGGAERQEKEPRHEPRFTVFLIRHGQSEEDKTKPNRGLTDLGKRQVLATMHEILEELRQESTRLEEVEFHLRDSGTERTLQQVWEEHRALLQAGVPEQNIVLPKAVLEYRGIDSSEAGPGIARRLKGVQGLDTTPEFRKKLRSKEYQEQLGASSDVEAWALAPEEHVPSGVETRTQMQERYEKDLATAERVINYKIGKHPKRVIVIANAHASIATLAAASEFSIPLDRLMKNIGEVPEAEGLRYDFYGAGSTHNTTPVGQKLREAVEALKSV